MKTTDSIIDDVIRAEGGYVNDPKDRGGATRWGITEKVARAAGYKGDMRELPQETAREIYRGRYVIAPGFGKVANLSQAIAAELVDTGVNMGPAIPSGFLQRSLNALNRQQSDYSDIVADGRIGPATIAALTAYLNKRGKEGETRLLALLNALQGARYLSLSEATPTQESFLYGWLGRITA